MTDLDNPLAFVANVPVVVALYSSGAIISQCTSDYRIASRCRSGVISNRMAEHGPPLQMLACMTHDYLLCFSTCGYMHLKPVHELSNREPFYFDDGILSQNTSTGFGRICVLAAIPDFVQECFVVMVTSSGHIKRIAADDLRNTGRRALRVIRHEESSHLAGVAVTRGNHTIALATRNGKILRFRENQIPFMGRHARGVRGIKLQDDDQVVSLLSCESATVSLLATTHSGYCKSCPLSAFPSHRRGTRGVKIFGGRRSDSLSSAALITSTDKVLYAVSSNQLMVRWSIEIPEGSRRAQGRKLDQLGAENYIECAGLIPESYR